MALGWHDRSVGSFVLGIVFMLAPAATGRVVATRAQLRDLLDWQATLLLENAEAEHGARVAGVRARIAGDVQALVGRRVHHMVRRCETARLLAPTDNRAAAQLLAAVEVDGRAALDEIRTMLGVLRTDNDLRPSSLQPQTDVRRSARARSLPVRRVEVVLMAAFVLSILAETLFRTGGLPTVSLTMLGPLVTFAVGTRTRGLSAVVGLAVAVAAIAAVNVVAGGAGWGDYVFPWVLVALAWSGGRLVRRQNELVARSRLLGAALEHSAQVRAAAAAGEERLRLARELHDVLGHTLMVMVVQTGAARRSLESGRAGATRAMRVVEDTGRDVEPELRGLFTEVTPGVDVVGMGADHTPGLGDLRSLVTRVGAAGVAADLLVEGEPVPVPEGLALAVYRVAQEAVTNVIRHADAQHLSVALRYTPALLRLEVSDDGRSSSGSSAEAGNGITGMRERAGIYGGVLSAGPSPGGGFIVEADFPLVRALGEQPA